MQASKEWRWVRCSHINRLLVDLGDELQLCTPYRLRQLTDDSINAPSLSISEAEFYSNVFDYLLSFKLWNQAQCCQIALNATAAKFHLLPMQAKSWFFNSYHGNAPLTDAVASLNSKVSQGDVLIVDHDAQSSLCISLSPVFQLDENLELEQFQAIKVLNDRLHPLINTHKISRSA